MTPLPEPFFDAVGRLLGIITGTPSGRLDLNAPDGRYLGSYDRATHRTYDAPGQSIGTGNQLPGMLPAPTPPFPIPISPR